MNKKTIKTIRLIIIIIIFLFCLYEYNFKEDLSDIKANVSTVSKEDVNGNLNIYFLDVGQADSILITNEDSNMLIDAGNNEDGLKLVDFIKDLGIEKLDIVVGTHPHEDHIGGMDDIINNFEIETYLMPDKLSTSKTFEDVLDALDKNNLGYKVPKEDEEINFNEAKIKILYSGDDSNDSNDSSIVLKMIYKNNSFLFTGDIASKIEKKLLDKDLKSDVLKIAHHGSNYSTSNAFLDKVNPEYAVISVGKNNTYNHPSLSTLEKLENKNVKLYRTDINGTIKLTSDGSNIKIESMETDTNG